MKLGPWKIVLAAVATFAIYPSTARAMASTSEAAQTWHPQNLWQALVYMLVFAATGIAAAIAGYKLFDKCTPGDLNKEILQNKNIAAAIVAAAVILGVCIIIAVAMLS
jgi:putative membrane protein